LRTAGDCFLDIQGMSIYFSRVEEQQFTASSTESPSDRGRQSVRPEQRRKEKRAANHEELAENVRELNSANGRGSEHRVMESEQRGKEDQNME
jgi:hypothetical protein